MITKWAAPGNEDSGSLFRVPLMKEDTPELPTIEVIEESQSNYRPKENSKYSKSKIGEVGI